LSGGIDSTALLAALATVAAEWPRRLRLRAVHVNHGLHPDGKLWAAQCRAFARSQAVRLTVLAARVPRSGGGSLEAAARDARYALLGGVLEAGEFLLTAHHEDDQVETVLLQLFRGAGLAGLAAMPAIAPFAGGWLARPLLSRSRSELEEWVRGAGLTWVEDATNSDESLDRNYLRRRVLPLIRERWKGVGSAVARSARHSAEGQRLLDTLARADVDRASSGADLSVQTLRALEPDRRRNALRFWISRSGVRVPDSRRLEELAGPVIDARPDANPQVAWADAEVSRHADLLTLRVMSFGGAAGRTAHGGPLAANGVAGEAVVAHAGNAHAVCTWSWRTQPTLELANAGGTLELKPDAHGPIDLDALPDTVTVRARRGGERIRSRRGGPRRALKSLLQEAHVPIAARATLPLIFSGETLLAAGALWLDESIQATAGAGNRGRLTHRGSVR
jgi:tRNA(Ile)-lysidine synthase